MSFTARGSALQPLLEDHATNAFYVDSTGRKTLASAGGGLTVVKETSHDRSVKQAFAAGVYFGPCTRHGSCPTPEQERWRSR